MLLLCVMCISMYLFVFFCLCVLLRNIENMHFAENLKKDCRSQATLLYSFRSFVMLIFALIYGIHNTLIHYVISLLILSFVMTCFSLIWSSVSMINTINI